MGGGGNNPQKVCACACHKLYFYLLHVNENAKKIVVFVVKWYTGCKAKIRPVPVGRVVSPSFMSL